MQLCSMMASLLLYMATLQLVFVSPVGTYNIMARYSPTQVQYHCVLAKKN